MGYFDDLKKAFIPEFIQVIVIYIILRALYTFILHKYFIMEILLYILYIGLFTYLIYKKDLDICNKDGSNSEYSLLNPLFTGLLILSILFGYLLLLHFLKILQNVPIVGVGFRVLNIPVFKHVFAFVLIYIIYNLIIASDGGKYCLNPPGIDRMSSKIMSTSVIFIINTIFYFILLLCKYYIPSITIYQIL